MTKTGLVFGILVIVICLVFVICDLKFLVTKAYCRMRKRPLKPPLGVARGRVLRVRILYLTKVATSILWPSVQMVTAP
jgi:hypothetical protein